MTSQQKSVFIYLFLRGESDGGRGGVDAFFFFCERQKVGRRKTKFWKTGVRRPRRVRVIFLACVRGVAVSSPQADTCGFNPPYADGRLFYTICVSVSPRAPSLVSPHLSHQPCLCPHSCSFDSSLPFSHNPYFLFMSPANIFPIQSHLFDEVLSSFCLP